MTTLAERQEWSARHEAGHSVADELLGIGRVASVQILGTHTEPGGGKTGLVRTEPNPNCDAEAAAVAYLAGPAADPRHDLAASRTAAVEVVREFAAHDVPKGLSNTELRKLWLVAVEFVEQFTPQIEAVASALLSSPIEHRESIYGTVTHELDGDAFRAALAEAD
jgi:hypothetical protein